jgi:NAD(P)-dependent dehydrogenase (short-subunit alcohol dehydrogenase family)
MIRRHEGRTAVISGAASGIGQASAIRLAKEGAEIIIADRDKAEKTLQLIADFGGPAVSADPYIYADVGQLATLHDGAAKLTDCATLQEAVSASPPSAQKIRATVKVIGVMNLSRRPKNGSVTPTS